MEFQILSALNFDITTPSSFRFLEKYTQMIGYDQSL